MSETAIGTLYTYKPTGEVFCFQGQPDNLFLQNRVRVFSKDLNESRDVDKQRFVQDYEPLILFGLRVVLDSTFGVPEDK